MENKELTFVECCAIAKTYSEKTPNFVYKIQIADEVDGLRGDLNIKTDEEFERACAHIDSAEEDVVTTGHTAIVETAMALVDMVKKGKIASGGVVLSTKQREALIDAAQVYVDNAE